jgi:hypothetical protein
LSQCIAKQRMVVGNDEMGVGGDSHLFLARGCGKPVTAFLRPAKRIFSFRSIVLCWAVACKRTIMPRGNAVNPLRCATQYARYRIMIRYFGPFVVFRT